MSSASTRRQSGGKHYILLYTMIILSWSSKLKKHAGHWTTCNSCSYHCSDCKNMRKPSWVAYCRFLSSRRWYLLSLLKCIWSSPDSVWTLLRSGRVFSYLARGDTIPRTYYNQSKISRNWMFSGLKHNFVI